MRTYQELCQKTEAVVKQQSHFRVMEDTGIWLVTLDLVKSQNTFMEFTEPPLIM